VRTFVLTVASEHRRAAAGLGNSKLNHEHKVFDGLCGRKRTAAAEWIKQK
jgi:hypothetical protein